MKILDITFDFETVARGADAAPMQLAAVIWDREATGEHPFTGEVFNEGIDLRSCVMMGLKFDQDTIDWWSRQDKSAKDAVMGRCTADLDIVITLFISWVLKMKADKHADAVCLWCQGMDFDVPILKHCCKLSGIDIDQNIDYQWFCDARSFVLQNLQLIYPDDVDMTKPKEAYKLLPSLDNVDHNKLPEKLQNVTNPHDALFDSMRSTWNVWQTMQKVKNK